MLGKRKNGGKRNGLIYRIVHGNRSLGQRTADGLAKWAGSWTFIILFFVFLGIWMATNGIFVLRYING